MKRRHRKWSPRQRKKTQRRRKKLRKHPRRRAAKSDQNQELRAVQRVVKRRQVREMERWIWKGRGRSQSRRKKARVGVKGQGQMWGQGLLWAVASTRLMLLNPLMKTKTTWRYFT